jgi:hypothetical protein
MCFFVNLRSVGLTNRVMSQGLLKKYRYCAERGRPDYNLNVGDIL